MVQDLALPRVTAPGPAPDPASATVAHPRRVTVVTPMTRVDLALPVQATVAEVVLQVVTLVGSHDADPEAAAGGWLLSRLGSPPFASGRSVGATDITDGDVLSLSRRSDRLPPVLFDDVVDAVAEATSARPDGWSATASRRTGTAVAVAILVSGSASLATAGAPWTPAVLTALTAAVLLVLAGAALARTAGDSLLGAVTAGSALPLACWAAARAVSDADSLLPGGPTALMLGGAALALGAVLAALAVGDLPEVFVGVGLVGTVATLAGLVASVWGVSAVAVAATTAVLATLAVPTFPTLAVRLARMPSPTIPTDMEEFRREETATPAEEMVAVARRTQDLLTALVLALVVVVAPCVVVLLADGRTWSLVLAGALSAALLLRAGQLLGLLPRLALLCGGLAGLAGLAGVLLTGAEPWVRVTAAPVSLLVAGALVRYVSGLPRRGASPYAGRLLDISEFVALASLLPVLGAVVGLYARARGYGG